MFYRIILLHYYFQITPSAKSEEARKACILFTIVIIFVGCNLPRTLLNIDESVSMIISYSNTYNDSSHQAPQSQDEATNCYSPPIWSQILSYISHLLLTLNASAGSIIYCAMCPIFRAELLSQFHKLQGCMSLLKRSLLGGRNVPESNEGL